MKLTHKQEKFVLGLIEGKSQRKSFIDAGYSVKGKTESYIDREASILFKNQKVSKRYEQLRDEAAKQSKWTRQKAFEEYEWLKNQAKNDIEMNGVKKSTADAFLGSLDGMNKMTFSNDDLTNKKIEKEIEMLSKRIEQLDKTSETGTENNLADALIQIAGGQHEL